MTSSGRSSASAVAATPLQGDYTNLGDVLVAAAAQHGELEAYVDGERRMSFAAWERASSGLAAALVERGVRPGDVVAIYLPSSIEYAVTYGAVALVGGVATGINPRLGPREVTSILDRAEPKLLVRDLSLGGPPSPGDLPVFNQTELLAACRGPRLHDRGPLPSLKDPAAIIWTSGTTGVPKGAWFDHRALAAAVRTAGVMSAPYDRRLIGTPFPHAGYMAKLWDQLAWGSTIVISPTPWTAAAMRRLMVDERITVAGGVPTQWAKLLEQTGLDEDDFSHLRLCLSATAPAAPELVERVTSRLGCPMVVRYAMTESPSITGTDPTDPPEVMFRTVGRPQAGVEVTLVGEGGSPVGKGEVGRVRVKGPCVMRGYWRDPELTAQVLDADGWLTSSDLGYIDPQGNLVLVGRSNDLYIRGGYNVYPLEVENALAEHPGVDRAAVVGLAAPVIGEIGVAFVVPVDPAAPPSLDALREWTRQRLADYKAPDRLELVDDLPLTPMAKIDKAELSRRLAQP